MKSTGEGDARLWAYALIGLALVSFSAVPRDAQGQQVATISKATTSRAAREDALRGIPFRSLSKQAQNRILAVVRKPTMFRRMPISVIQSDPELHQFLVRYPEVVVNVWQVMGITKVTASRVAPYVLDCSDGVGTVTRMELVYGDHDTHLLFCEGSYEGPMFRTPLTGRCVLVLKSGAAEAQSGYQITNRLDVFLKVDHAGVDVFAKTLHPLLGKSADLNFIESMRFIQRMSQAAERNSAGMMHLADRMHDIDPAVRDRFQNVVTNVSNRSLQVAGKSNRTYSVDANDHPETPAQSPQSVPRAAIRSRPVTIRGR